jgi:hypothetical protein
MRGNVHLRHIPVNAHYTTYLAATIYEASQWANVQEPFGRFMNENIVPSTPDP